MPGRATLLRRTILPTVSFFWTRIPTYLEKLSIKRWHIFAQEISVGGGATIVSDRPFPAFVRGMLATWNRASAVLGLAAGSFLFCPAQAFVDTGGFDERVYAGEEIWFSRALKKWGRKNGRRRFPIITDPPVITSARKGDMFGSPAIAFQLFAILLCPWITRSRRLCPGVVSEAREMNYIRRRAATGARTLASSWWRTSC